MMDVLRPETHRRGHKMCNPEATVKLVNSVSDQNVFFTYVCTVNNIKPETFERHNKPSNYLDGDTEEIDDEDPPIQVERSKALHELVESHKNDKADAKYDDDNRNDNTTPYTTATTSGDESEFSENENIVERNPNILKLTKMKWLTEEQPGSPDSSSPNITPVLSSTSTNYSRESDEDLSKSFSSDKYLSTILRYDKEHNLFGLSNIAIVGSRPSRKIKNQDERPVFHQTAIVQVCCGSGCCRHVSKTDLPSSLKCPTCRPCCIDSPFCPTCNAPPPPSCPSSTCAPCPSAKCAADCTSCFGLKISVSRKPKYEPSPIEITPRSSCILQKPVAARPCNHCPQCIPPSSCFPYLMPCFWPSRAGAPCSVPTRCFHNPPCRAPRRPKSEPVDVCPPKCEDKDKKCGNKNCPGLNQDLKKEIETRYSGKGAAKTEK